MVDENYDPQRRWWTLAVLCLSLIIVVVGNTVLNVALPTLVRQLHATSRTVGKSACGYQRPRRFEKLTPIHLRI